jgi:UDP-glucuronate 4-epimerase
MPVDLPDLPQLDGVRTVLITGAAGFIGSHCAEALAAAGKRVIGVDNFSDFYDRKWKEQNLRDLVGVDVEEMDITDGVNLERVVRLTKPQAILHLAAMAGVRPSIEQPAYYARVNVEGTTHLLEAARRSGVKRFVFASSSSVYGNLAHVPFSESDDVGEPISPYAATKRAGELICHTFWHLYQLPISSLRFFTVYGPRQRPDLAIHKFTRLIRRGEPIPFYGDGMTSRDYTYVDDIVRGILRAMAHTTADRGHRVYNLGGGSPVTLAKLINELETAVGKKANLQKLPAQPGDVRRTFADLKRATEELGYEPQVSLAEGLSRFAAWHAEHGSSYEVPG